jgi:hypothetical protein
VLQGPRRLTGNTSGLGIVWGALIYLATLGALAVPASAETAPSGRPSAIVTPPPGGGATAGPKAKNAPVSHDDKASPGEGVVADTDSKARTRVKTKPRARVETKNKEVPQRFGEGPSPASPPPLTISELRDEIHRESPARVIDPASPPHEKVEQMLAEVTKARTALHVDTDRLEAMLIAGDGAAEATSAGAGPASGGAKPAPKNPLDILAKALRGIKPSEAAPIVSRLDKRLAANVLQRMPPADAGKIMGAMKPDTAAELATQIAMRQLSGEAKK